MSFTVLHIGDLHFWRISANPFDYLGKRLLGNGNLLLRRARQFRSDVAPELVARIAGLRPDRVLFSGDFTTTALDAEFALARAALRPLEANLPGRILAVPGNHDRYTIRSIRGGAFERHFGDWRPAPAWPWFGELESGFPVLGIDGGTSNGLDSFGRFRRADAAALRAWWKSLDPRPRELAVLCHFPAEVPAPLVARERRGPQFLDAQPLLDFLAETGVPVWYLHGHHHHRWVYSSPSVPRLVYLDAGAPLLARGGAPPDLGFLELRRDGGETSLALHTRAADAATWRRETIAVPAQGNFADLQRQAVAVPAG